MLLSGRAGEHGEPPNGAAWLGEGALQARADRRGSSVLLADAELAARPALADEDEPRRDHVSEGLIER